MYKQRESGALSELASFLRTSIDNIDDKNKMKILGIVNVLLKGIKPTKSSLSGTSIGPKYISSYPTFSENIFKLIFKSGIMLTDAFWNLVYLNLIIIHMNVMNLNN